MTLMTPLIARVFRPTSVVLLIAASRLLSAQQTVAPPATSTLAAAASDSIVRLAVDPAKFKGQPVVLLLDEGIYRVEPDGRGARRTRQVMQVLDASAVRGLSERAYSYAKTHQIITVHWVRVLKPNGDVVSDKVAQEQESDVPAAMSNPIYQNQRLKRLSLSGVAVGTILDIAWTLEETTPSRAGDFFFRWNVNNTTPIVSSRFVLNIPDGFAPRIAERNLTSRRTELVAGGRRLLTWSVHDEPGIVLEPFAADSNDVVKTVTIAPPGSWNDLAHWYDALARDRYALNAPVAQRIDSLVRASGARSRLDTIRAVRRWAAQDVRYVSVALGIGGYQPRTPAEVISTGFGDCKDKATLFVAALRRYGIQASPVLLALGGRPDRALPSIYQFNHAIAAVREGKDWTYTDLTADVIPYGVIPDAYQGAFGIIINPDGSAQEITFPITSANENVNTQRLILAVDTSGHVSGHVTEESLGVLSYPMRGAFASPLDSARRAALGKALAQRIFAADATVDSIVAFDGRDERAHTQMSYRIVADATLKAVGDVRLFTLSPTIRGPARAFRNLARDLESRPKRVFPIDAAQLLTPTVAVVDLHLTLPNGWKAELPKNVTTTTFFGRYESTWTQVGSDVHLVRRITGARGYFPSARIVEVITWLKAVGMDDYEFLSLRQTSSL